VKTKKPTGDAYYPPEVKRAHQIDELITKCSYTREISDNKLDGSDNTAEEDLKDDNSGNSSEEVAVCTKIPGNTIHNAIIRHPEPTVQRHAPRILSDPKEVSEENEAEPADNN
jgi:hypothetical protein